MKDIDLPARKQDLLFSDNPFADWQHFYQRIFSVEIEEKDFTIPTCSKDAQWLIVIPSWIYLQRAVEVSQCFYPVVIEGIAPDEIETCIHHHDRMPGSNCVLWVRDGMNADQTHDRKSADEMTGAGISGITLLEYLLLHLYIYWTSGEHLDEDTITLCVGSRYVDGGIPAASWYDRKGLQIHCHKTHRKWPTAACREVWTDTNQ